MIRSCLQKDVQLLLERRFSRRFYRIEKAARLRLESPDAATPLLDLELPGLRLEALKGARKGQYGIRIHDQFRICFQWRSGDAHNVEIVDCH